MEYVLRYTKKETQQGTKEYIQYASFCVRKEKYEYVHLLNFQNETQLR